MTSIGEEIRLCLDPFQLKLSLLKFRVALLARA
jgi:hypothetical protein